MSGQTFFLTSPRFLPRERVPVFGLKTSRKNHSIVRENKEPEPRFSSLRLLWKIILPVVASFPGAGGEERSTQPDKRNDDRDENNKQANRQTTK